VSYGYSLDPNVDKFIMQIVNQLSNATNHRHFGKALRDLSSLCVANSLTLALSEYEILTVIERFLKTRPLNDDDRLLLMGLLRFLRNATYSNAKHKQLHRLVFESLENVFLFVLEDLASIELNSANGTHHDLATEIVTFFRWMFSRMERNMLEQFVATPKFLKVLVLYTHFKFASETEMAKNHGKRIDCLMSLLPFTGLPNLGSLVREESILALISVLVQVIGYSQQNYFGASGDGFTYKDRRVYRLAVINLRNISRSSFLSSATCAPWGDHWLFEDELQWMLVP
jgi:hypothetical protein